MTEEVKQPEAETQTQPAQESPDLTVNDLNSLRTIIDIASSRGAFKPAEFAAVGQTYAKLAAFLATVNKQQGA